MFGDEAVPDRPPTHAHCHFGPESFRRRESWRGKTILQPTSEPALRILAKLAEGAHADRAVVVEYYADVTIGHGQPKKVPLSQSPVLDHMHDARGGLKNHRHPGAQQSQAQLGFISLQLDVPDPPRTEQRMEASDLSQGGPSKGDIRAVREIALALCLQVWQGTPGDEATEPLPVPYSQRMG